MSNNGRKSRHATTMNGTPTRDTTAEQSPGAEEPLAFEEALGRLDEMVAALEGGLLPLEDALTLFEEGVRMAQRCQQMLDTAALRVQRLRAVTGGDDDATSSDSGFVLETFEIDDE